MILCVHLCVFLNNCECLNVFVCISASFFEQSCYLLVCNCFNVKFVLVCIKLKFSICKCLLFFVCNFL